MPLHLYLIRHGETEWALSSRHTGHSDIPLTVNGKDEARKLGPQLQGISFAHVLSSPLKRARQTCKLVALNGVPEIEPDLVEWNYGDYEGKKSVNIRRERRDWDVFRDGCPHGEMPAQVLARADRLIRRLRMLEGNVALFSHGQFGGVLGARWIGMPLENARHFPLGTVSVSILGYDPDHTEVPVISLWNYHSHPFSHSVQPPPSGQTMTQRAIQRWENEGGEIPVEGSKPSSLVQVPLLMP